MFFLHISKNLTFDIIIFKLSGYILMGKFMKGWWLADNTYGKVEK